MFAEVTSMARAPFRIFVAAIIVTVALIGDAAAQGKGGKPRGGDQKSEAAAKKNTVNEGAYQRALERIPVAKGKPDPWKDMR